ncbi:MAG: decarboxylating 6-phosphogluconate dehydrogenase [Gemmatimonadales bacterium]|jgi:6-phosphogluconate dehydrogenase
MELGMIGLGRMGANMTERLLKGDHRVVAYDRDSAAIERVVDKGALGAESIQSLVEQLASPRAIWIMVPAGDPVDETIQALLPLMAAGDVVLDGGNSNYRDTVRRSVLLEKNDLHFVDVGTSGGVWGLKEGYSLMVGGPTSVVERLGSIFETLAPGPKKGWGHVGPNGAGHFVKMVHNGIEYGMMQAFAEGFSLMKHKTEFDLDLHQVAEIWRYGSVVRSWLLDLTARALGEDQSLENVAPYVQDSGEGRWTVFESIDLDVPAPVTALSLIQRLRSRDDESYADRLLAAMRNQFGGHAIKREG